MKEDKERLEIIVEETQIEVANFQSYADDYKFFAVGTDGHLYYRNRDKKTYDLLSKDFRKTERTQTNDTYNSERST